MAETYLDSVKKKVEEAKARKQQYQQMSQEENINEFLQEKAKLQQPQTIQTIQQQPIATATPTIQQTTTAVTPTVTTPANTGINIGANIAYDVNTGQWKNVTTGQMFATAPADLDPTIAMLKGYYADQEKRGNIQGMIWAAEQADLRRQELGLQPINTQLIQRLKQQLGTAQPTTASTPTTQQPTGAFVPPQQPAVTYEGGIPTLTQPQYQPYISPYEGQIKQILDQIASQPAYQSPYAAILNDMINKITTREFDYNPETDPEFQRDSRILSQAIMEEMNARGILSSTITVDRVQQAIKDLMVDYSSRAYQRYLDEGQQLLQQANFIMGIDERGYQRYQDEYTRKANMLNFLLNLDERQYNLYKDAMEADYEMRKDQYESALNIYKAQLQRIEDAWDRVNELGYVDNQASIILGIPAGTLSKEAREAKETREAALAEAQIEAQSKLDELDKKHKQALELEQVKYIYESALTQQKQEYKTPTLTEIRNLTPSQLGTSEQVANYNKIKSETFKAANGDANAALQMIMTTEGIQEILGGPLYQKLIDDFQQLANVQKAITSQTTTSPVFKPDDYYKIAKEMKEAKEIVGNVESRIYSDAEVIAYILSAPLTEAQQAEILNALYPKGEAEEYLKVLIESSGTNKNAAGGGSGTSKILTK